MPTEKEHLISCTPNYLGTSRGMEVDGAIKNFHRSTLLYNGPKIGNTKLLGDRDTNAFLSVSDSEEPYGPDEAIKNLMCRPHPEKDGNQVKQLKIKKKGVKLADSSYVWPELFDRYSFRLHKQQIY